MKQGVGVRVSVNCQLSIALRAEKPSWFFRRKYLLQMSGAMQTFKTA